MKVKKKEIVRDVLFLLISLISSVICFTSNEAGYSYMFILPLAFNMCFLVGLKSIIGMQGSIFCNVFTMIAFLRYVILPPITVHTKYYLAYTKYTPTSNERNFAVFLMAYELIAVTVTIVIMYKKDKALSVGQLINGSYKYRYEKWHVVTILTILLICIVSLLNSAVISQFNFITPSLTNALNYSDNYRFYEDTSAMVKLLAIVFNVFLTLIFINAMIKYAIKYKKTNNYFYFIVSTACGLLNIVIYQGANRSAMMIKGIATVILLLVLFPKKKKQLLCFFSIVIFSVLILISSARNHDVLSSALKIAKTLDEYVAGPEDVAVAMHIDKYSGNAGKLIHFIYDLCRPIIGLGSLIKTDTIMTTPEMYNYVIYGSTEVASILPFIGQGYYYLGFLLAPILEMVFVGIANCIEKNMKKGRNLLMTYFWIFIVVRMGFFMAQNSYIQINSLFVFYVIPALILKVNHILISQRKEGIRDMGDGN